jgi:hypothetical protein
VLPRRNSKNNKMTNGRIKSRRSSYIWRCAYAHVAVIAITFLSGCSSSYQLDTAKVHGTVTLDGQPLDAGLVFFRPEKGRMAVGKIQPNGSYVLFTYVRDGDDGAIVGRHKVSVVPPLPSAESEIAPEMKSPIPNKYQSEGTSRLEFEVEAGKDNKFDIALSSAK